MGKILFMIMTLLTVTLSADEDLCTKETLVVFFPQPFVEKTMAKFDVDADLRESILDDLTGKDPEILATIDSRSEMQGYNPLKDPSKRNETVQLFNQVVLESFTQIMEAHGITDTAQIKDMYSDIQRQKAERFRLCHEMMRKKSNS